MANNGNKANLPAIPFQVHSSPNLVFSPSSKSDTSDELADQSQGFSSEAVSTTVISSTSPIPGPSIFPSPSFHTQGVWETSGSFGGTGLVKTEASVGTDVGACSFVSKTETLPTFGVPATIKPTHGDISNSFVTSNLFSNVSSKDPANKGTPFFGSPLKSSSTVPKIFGGTECHIEGGLLVQKTREAKQSNISISKDSTPSSEAGSSVTAVPLSTSTPVLFGGVISSSTASIATTKWPATITTATTASSHIFGAVESSQTATLFGGSAVFSTSNIPGITTVSKSSSGGSKTSFPLQPSNINDEGKESNLFLRSSTSGLPFISHQDMSYTGKSPVSKTSVKGSMFGGTSSAEKPTENTPMKSSKKRLIDKTEASKGRSVPTGHRRSQEKLEPTVTNIVKPKEVPEIFGKDEGHASGTSPKYHKKELTKLIIALIPDCCMDKEILKSHFEKYGEVKRITLNPKVNQATVQYNNHHAASKAKKKGKEIHPKLPELKIFYATPVRRKSEEGNSDAMMSKKRAIKTLQHVQQPSDLDPYIPLERPTAEEPISKVMPLKVSHLDVKKPSTSRKKQSRPVSPARENKDTAISFEGKDLKTILESQATNNCDRYTILKARDKLLRNERTRTSDLKKATYLAATCPDMCPELERYMRDVQNDLSFYEMTTGVLDHRLVTKKFSRSSADKDVPLPHELRPGPVLLRTMDFLVCNIINQADTEETEVDIWYNYLWNRTRAIRNDLMQQQLTDSNAVVIMERCTRFHIYAAARLCQEPPDLFDAKMNTEHLTKSLQTLKELYLDLGERGEYFDTEPEFRAYEMLLNLNDGERIVTQYSKFRGEVQKSSHVQFALKAVLAVTFNNYVKFFKLLKSATYLQGCLLHRYFRQVRSKALDTFMKAYVPTKAPQTLPMESVIKTLGFENETDAVAYLKCHGITADDQNVVFDKYSFIQNPEEIPPLIRPIKLIEIKRTSALGEVIQGGPIPDNPLYTHIPHNSFDERGHLKPGAKDASDQNIENHQKPLPALTSVHTVVHPVKQQNYVLLAHMKDVYNVIEASVLEEIVRKVSIECIELFQHEVLVDKAACSLSSELLKESIQEEIKIVSYETMKEAKEERKEALRKLKEEEAAKREALRKLYDSVAATIFMNYVNEFVDGYIKQICQEYLQEVEMQNILTSLSEELPLKYETEVITELLISISKEVIEEMIAAQEMKVQNLQQKICNRKLSEYFCKWRTQVLKARRRKQSQEMFPADCSHLSITQQNEAFGWGYQRSSIENKSALQLSTLESNISRKVEKTLVRNMLVRECAWHPLYMQCLLMEEVDKFLPANTHNLFSQYFKLLVCTADSANSTIMQWLHSKLGSEENNDIQKPLNYCFSFVSKKSGLEYSWAIRETPVNSLSPENIKGTSAVLFVTSSKDTEDSQYCTIQNLLKERQGTSFYTVFYNCKSCDSKKSWSLSEEDLLKPETSLKLQNILLGLWKQQEERMTLVSSRMNNFVCGFIAEKFVEPALRYQNERNADKKSPLPPSILIDLYNKVIDFLITVINDKDLQSLEWPPPELSHLKQIPPPTWNNIDVKHVAGVLSHLKLPELQMDGIMSWGNITKVLHTYVTKVSGPLDDGIRLASHLNTILTNSFKILASANGYDDEASSDCEIHVLQLPWTELVYACASFRLSELSDIPVFYQPKKLKSFMYPHSWWAACDTSDPVWTEALKENYPLNSRKRKAEKQDKLVNNQVKLQKTPSKLLSDIANEKQKFMEFEKRLESLLNVDEI
ncbi:germinal-center associated nuclear protein [Cherax quadricarinatus]|uniref:germinal-center associated nuclear protein n=1 Tax=Cherax quadricarinatus TaxID=27406 RepID=UPI00387E6563